MKDKKRPVIQGTTYDIPIIGLATTHLEMDLFSFAFGYHLRYGKRFVSGYRVTGVTPKLDDIVGSIMVDVGLRSVTSAAAKGVYLAVDRPSLFPTLGRRSDGTPAIVTYHDARRKLQKVYVWLVWSKLLLPYREDLCDCAIRLGKNTRDWTMPEVFELKPAGGDEFGERAIILAETAANQAFEIAKCNRQLTGCFTIPITCGSRAERLIVQQADKGDNEAASSVSEIAV